MATQEALSDTLREVHIHDPPATEPEPNPWQEPSPTTPVTRQQPNPDLSQLDSDATQGLAAAPPTESAERPPAKPEILLEFDPLASAEEKAAQQAWADAEGHPPPPAPLPPPVPAKEPVSPTPQTPNRPSSPIPAFPALAALARTFALPLQYASEKFQHIEIYLISGLICMCT